MEEGLKNETSYKWWFNSHNNSDCSPWLQSTLDELNEKTTRMLKLIEEDADSFSQRAEMYFEKRPDLIEMVQDFYRTNRSLAERYDRQAKNIEHGTRLLTNIVSPFTSFSEKPYINNIDDTCSDTEEYAESEVEDPEDEDHKSKFLRRDYKTRRHDVEEHEVSSNVRFHDDEVEVTKLRSEIERLERENVARKEEATRNDEEMKEMIVRLGVAENDARKLRDEIKIVKDETTLLKEENRSREVQLWEKDEEKREVIRQLSIAVEMLKDENVKLRKYIVKKSSRYELSKLKYAFFNTFFMSRRM